MGGFEFYWLTLGFIPLFTSRMFIPLFLTAIIARYPNLFTWLTLPFEIVQGQRVTPLDLAGIELIHNLPPYCTADITIIGLGVLALAEVLSMKNSDVRELVMAHEAKLKALIGTVCTIFFAIGNGHVTAETTGIALNALLNDGEGMNWFNYIWAVGVGNMIWFLAKVRGTIFAVLADIDPEDDVGFQKIVLWLEDIIGGFTLFLVVALPLFGIAVLITSAVTLFILKAFFIKMDERKKVSCPKCKTMVYPCGTKCYHCGNKVVHVRNVGFLGSIKSTVTENLQEHKQNMRVWKRCFSCGSRLKGNSLNQQCHRCKTIPFANHNDVSEYRAYLRRRMPRVVFITFLLSLVPVFGLIPGIIYYRSTLITPIKGYISKSRNFMIKWGMRVINLILICLQVIPIIGAVTLPIMCYLNYLAYDTALRKGCDRIFTRPTRMMQSI